MGKTVLITGGSGFIGSALSRQLQQEGYSVRILTRGTPGEKHGIVYHQWNPSRGQMDAMALKDVDAIIHLAGKNLADGLFWSEKDREQIISSRVDGLHLLHAQCQAIGIAPKIICAGGVAAYFNGPMGEFTEESPVGSQFFLGTVCLQWEEAAQSFESLGAVVSIVRTGVVFTPSSLTLKPFRSLAMFPFLALPYQGNIGMSWIHLHDLVRIYQYVLNHNLPGIVNATAPHPLTLKQMLVALRKGVRQPVVGIPPGLVRFLLGAKADILLTGGLVFPKRLEAAGFHFNNPTFSDLIPNA